ncbi:MAG TPA: LLM class flavin-dependent oxidoreductase [Candidatus Dormibacteraeota bacterium]|nr:LLM class flavin-dependent oxidoreductase [Candidatus Dormibacteraeota bacterium]
MKAALFNIVPYLGQAERTSWPAPGRAYDPEVAQRSTELALEQFQLADELGFDWVTLAEHHFAPLSLTPNPMVMAGAVTQRVRRARIALLGATIPILNPVRVAEEFAMLDTLTGGRVVAGMLRGTANEYVTYDVNPAESRARFEEAMALIVRAWTEPEPFGWQGRYYRFRTVSIWPRPVQRPHPPIYMSGSSPEAGEFAARHHLSIGLAFTTLPLARAATEHYRACARSHGWEPAPDDVLYRVTAHVAESDDEALEDLRGAGADTPRRGFSLSNRRLDDAAAGAGYYGRDAAAQRGRIEAQGRPMAERIEAGQLLAGGPDTVLAQARRIRDELGAGILELVFQPMGREKTLRAIELFGRSVLPSLSMD